MLLVKRKKNKDKKTTFHEYTHLKTPQANFPNVYTPPFNFMPLYTKT